MRLCAASRPVSSLPLSSRRSPGFQRRDFLARERVEVHALRVGVGRPVDRRASRRASAARASPGREPSSTKCAWRVAAQFGIIATGFDSPRASGYVADLHVEHGGQAAEALRADAERVHLVVELDAQLLDLASSGRAP